MVFDLMFHGRLPQVPGLFSYDYPKIPSADPDGCYRHTAKIGRRPYINDILSQGLGIVVAVFRKSAFPNVGRSKIGLESSTFKAGIFVLRMRR